MPGKATEKHNLTPLAPDDLHMLEIRQPGLGYNPARGIVSGTLVMSALWDGRIGHLMIDPLFADSEENLIRDKFEVAIHLRYRTRWFGTDPELPNRYPPVFDTGNRALSVAENGNITTADLHLMTNGECCLGFYINKPTRETFRIVHLIEQDIIPWFYRLAYTERFGLEKTEKDLWKAYSHHEKGLFEYLDGLLKAEGQASHDGDPCPCGSEASYASCHGLELDQARADGLIKT